MREPGALLILVPVGLGTLVALFSVLRVLFPRLVGGAKTAAEEMAGRSFVLGFVNALFLSVIVAALSALGERGAGILQVLALMVMSLVTIGLAFGLAGMASLTGERLLPDAGPTRQTAWGAAALAAACLTPFLGWFALFPYLSIRGFGGFLIGLFRRPPA